MLPKNEPSHEYIKPRKAPCAVTLNETITSKGRAGIIDSKKDNRIGAIGPIFLKFSIKVIQNDISVMDVYHCNSVFIELYLNSYDIIVPL